MTQPTSTDDPSVDEILTSIREIIAEEEVEAVPAEDDVVDTDDDILELTEADEAPTTTELADLVEVDDDVVDQEQMSAVGDAPVPSNDDIGRAASELLLAGGAAAATTDALHRLSAAVAPGDALPAGERSIEAFLTDLLRPELKVWLDQHLAPLVERIVEREIKRLVRDAEPA